MLIKVRETEVELPNDSDSIEHISKLVNEALEDKAVYFSHFIVDGVEVFEEYQLYFEENIARIQEVEAVMKSIEEFILGLTLSIESYIARALPEVEALADELYQGKQSIGSEKTLQFVEGMQWVFQAVGTIDQTEKKSPAWGEVLVQAVKLEASLQEVEEALQNEDEVLFADILQYEITPGLNDLYNKVTSIINEEGMRHDIN